MLHIYVMSLLTPIITYLYIHWFGVLHLKKDMYQHKDGDHLSSHIIIKEIVSENMFQAGKISVFKVKIQRELKTSKWKKRIHFQHPICKNKAILNNKYEYVYYEPYKINFV